MRRPKFIRVLWDGEITEPPPMLWLDEYMEVTCLWGRWRPQDGARQFVLPQNWVVA